MAFKWYFLRCQSGREKRIRDNAIHRLKIAGVDSVVPQVLMPFKIVMAVSRSHLLQKRDLSSIEK